MIYSNIHVKIVPKIPFVELFPDFDLIPYVVVSLSNRIPLMVEVTYCNTHEFLYFNKIKYFLFSYLNLHFICVPKCLVSFYNI